MQESLQFVDISVHCIGKNYTWKNRKLLKYNTYLSIMTKNIGTPHWQFETVQVLPYHFLER
jgi:hypothetical protein